MTASGDEYIYRADFTDYNGDNYFRLHDGAFEYGASDTDKVVVLGEEYTLSKNSKNSFKGNDNLNGKKVIFHFSPSANRFSNPVFEFALAGEAGFTEAFPKYTVNPKENEYCDVVDSTTEAGTNDHPFSVFTYKISLRKGASELLKKPMIYQTV